MGRALRLHLHPRRHRRDVGLFTRPIAFAFAVQLGVITFMLQMPNGYFWTSRGMEFALALFLVCIAFVFGGGGKYSLDRRIGREF